MAAALGVRGQPGVPTVETLARVLARRQLLLILDNCEHVIGAAAGLCAGLLPAVRRASGPGDQPGAAASGRGGAVPAGVADAARPE